MLDAERQVKAELTATPSSGVSVDSLTESHAMTHTAC